MLQAEIMNESLDVISGMEIYNLIKNNPSLSPAQLVNLPENTHLYTSFDKVIKEKAKLFVKMNDYSSGNKLLEAEVTHFDEETGDIVVDSPAVYYKLTTETDFKSQFASDLLDVNEVYKDWKGNRTWTEVKTPNTQQ